MICRGDTNIWTVNSALSFQDSSSQPNLKFMKIIIAQAENDRPPIIRIDKKTPHGAFRTVENPYSAFRFAAKRRQSLMIYRQVRQKHVNKMTASAQLRPILPQCKNKSYADKLFLPLSLLLAKTLRPFFVLILFLKPCSFARCLFLGWNVLSIIIPPWIK